VRRTAVVVATVVAALAAPAAARATTYDVAVEGGACGGSDHTCGTVAAAAGAVGNGDVVNIAPGTYNGDATFTAAGVIVTGSSEGGGVIVNGTLTFNGGGASPSILRRLIVAQAGSGAAVVAGGAAGVSIRDAVLLSAAGPGLAISAGASNALVRSSVLVAASGGTAVSIGLGGSSAALKIDSSVVGGGAAGTGLAVTTGQSTLLSAGSATVTARHATIAGAAVGISLDSSSATGLLSAAGNIAVDVSDSILEGATPTRTNTGLLGILAPNTATLSLARTDQTTAPDALFVSTARRNYHLRADAPVIDKGQTTEGDSATDLDGQPRTAGQASDLGADEFGNTPPTAAIALKTATPRRGQPVTFDGSGSTDRDSAIGGPISQYRWTFGDGTSETTATPTVEHVYAREGALVAQLVVADRQGAASTPATVPVRLLPGTVPTVTISRPKAKARLALLAKRRKGARKRARAKIAFRGTARAAGPVKSVVLTIEKLGTSRKTCTWVDRSRGLRTTPCAKPVFITARLAGARWSYTTARALKLRKGHYRVSAYGTDARGGFGNAAPAARRIVRFTLR
jgi:hypothetical protein